MVKVTVKWNKQVFSEVDLDPSDSVETFKTQLFTLTGVPLERQKLMAKGGWKGILKDDADLSSAATITPGLQIMLMGSADVVAAPKVQTLFKEDLKEEELAASGAALPAGLVNLGNTCYMNSTLQCLRKVRERPTLPILPRCCCEHSSLHNCFCTDCCKGLLKAVQVVAFACTCGRCRSLSASFWVSLANATH